MKKATIAMLQILILMLAAVATGCGGSAPGSVEPAAADQAEPEAETPQTEDGKDMVVLRTASDPASFDPSLTNLGDSIKIVRQTYDGLVYVDNDHEVEMMLAESYEVSEDNKLNDELGFNKPFPVRFADYLGGIWAGIFWRVCCTAHATR